MIFNKLEQLYKKMVYTRADDNGCVFYFSAADFEGLHQTSYLFKSSKGHMLQGYFYYYDNYIPGRLVMFEHGMGSGHRGYMKEIELLAREGYLVFSYDHTGCMESGGETTGGFIHSLIDLNDAINALQEDAEYRDLEISVIGHSWGALSTLNISALHPEVRHQIALAGPISVAHMLKQSFGGLLSGVGKRILENERKANPDFIGYDAITALKNTSAKVLVIHSDDDPTVKCSASFDLLERAVSGRENITFVKVTGKRHNPNYTEDAVRYKDAFFAVYQKVMRKGQLSTESERREFKSRYDWDRMTAQDEAIWALIFKTLR